MKILNPETAFSASQRRELLDLCFPAMRRREQVVAMIESADPDVQRGLRPELEQLNQQIRDAWTAYQQGLPFVALSRCPFTGDVWSHSFDPFGIDGLWWNCYQPIRRLDEPPGGKFYAFRGAVAAPAEAFSVPFLVEPGPDVPFLIERLLQFPSITAVVSHTRVGDLDAYPIVYFSQESLPPDERTNDWAADSYSYRDERGYYEEGQYFDAEDEFLYDLTPWIAQGRVQWIRPGDDSLTLQTGQRDCPYCHLAGRRAVWRCKNGRIWWGPAGK